MKEVYKYILISALSVLILHSLGAVALAQSANSYTCYYNDYTGCSLYSSNCNDGYAPGECNGSDAGSCLSSSGSCRQAKFLDLSSSVGNIYNLSMGLGALLALAVLVFGGISYSVSAGNPGRIEEAKKWIWAAIIGLLILFGAFLLVANINPDLTTLDDVFVVQNIKKEVTLTTIPPPITYEQASEIIVRDPVVTGTYSCKWVEGSPTPCQNVEPNNCQGGFVPNNCTYIPEQTMCESFIDRICVWKGGSTYSTFAAVARSYSTPFKEDGASFPNDARHQAYSISPPTTYKDPPYNECYGADCGVFVSTVVRNTIDPSFPLRGTPNMRSYLENSPLYQMVPIASVDELRPGDILMPYKTAYEGHNAYCPTRRDGTHMPCGTGHIAIWLDDGEYEAAYSSISPCGNGEYLPKGPSGWKTNMGNAFRYVGFQ